MSCMSAGEAELAEHRAFDPERARLRHREDRHVHHVGERVVVVVLERGEREQRRPVLRDGLGQRVDHGRGLLRVGAPLGGRHVPELLGDRARVRVDAPDGRHVGDRRLDALLHLDPAHLHVRQRRDRRLVAGHRLERRQGVHERDDFLLRHVAVEGDALDADALEPPEHVAHERAGARQRHLADHELAVDHAEGDACAAGRRRARGPRRTARRCARRAGAHARRAAPRAPPTRTGGAPRRRAGRGGCGRSWRPRAGRAECELVPRGGAGAARAGGGRLLQRREGARRARPAECRGDGAAERPPCAAGPTTRRRGAPRGAPRRPCRLAVAARPSTAASQAVRCVLRYPAFLTMWQKSGTARSSRMDPRPAMMASRCRSLPGCERLLQHVVGLVGPDDRDRANRLPLHVHVPVVEQGGELRAAPRCRRTRAADRSPCAAPPGSRRSSAARPPRVPPCRSSRAGRSDGGRRGRGPRLLSASASGRIVTGAERVAERLGVAEALVVDRAEVRDEVRHQRAAAAADRPRARPRPRARAGRRGPPRAPAPRRAAPRRRSRRAAPGRPRGTRPGRGRRGNGPGPARCAAGPRSSWRSAPRSAASLTDEIQAAICVRRDRRGSAPRRRRARGPS